MKIQIGTAGRLVAPGRAGVHRFAPLLSSLVRYRRAAGPAGLATRAGPPPAGPVRSAPGKNVTVLPTGRA